MVGNAGPRDDTGSFAAEADKWDIVKVLLERGAAVTVERHTKSALMMAAHAGELLMEALRMVDKPWHPREEACAAAAAATAAAAAAAARVN